MSLGANFGILASSGGVAALINAYSIDFDGTDDHVAGGNVTSLNGSATASWTFWVKRDDVTRFEVPVSQYGSGDDRLFQFRFVGNNRIDFFIKGAVMWKDTSLNVTFENDTWYNITIAYNGATSGTANKVNIYINGVKETNTQGSNITTMPASTSDFQFGRLENSAGNFNNYFDGHVDEVAFFDVELSQAQATTLYNDGIPYNLDGFSGLTDWWRNGDNNGGSGTALTAAAGGVDGTLTNGASYVEDVPS